MIEDGRRDAHPTPDELRCFLRGELPTAQVGPLLVHLDRGCAACRAVMAPTVAVMFAPGRQEGPPPEGVEERYELPMRRAIATALRHQKLLAAQHKAVERKIAGGEEVKLAELPPELAMIRRWVYVERLLEEGEARRTQLPPRLLEEAATRTLRMAQELTSGPFGLPAVADLQARAWAELANAYRLQEEYDHAESAFEQVAACLRRGSRDPRLRARLMDLMASLCRDQRRLEEADRLLAGAGAIYRRLGEDHLAGRIFMNRCTVANYMGRPEAALAYATTAVQLIDADQDRQLAVTALHNVIGCLVDVGRVEEAASFLWRCRPAFKAGGPSDKLRLRWYEGRIAAGTGQTRRAERIFTEVREAFTKAELLYAAALAGLDLAALFLADGRTTETCALVQEMYTTFHRLGIAREALASLLILHEALAKGEATVALVRQLATKIRQLEALGAGRRSRTED